MKIVCLLFLALTIIPWSGAAADVYWTDWTSTSTSQVNGTLSFGPQTVNVTFSGSYAFAQLSSGTDYWIENSPKPYTSATVPNRPPAPDIIGLNAGGLATISFSQPVLDPLVALVSWNGNTVDFNEPITILSYGAGYWGYGTPILNSDGDGFYGSGEVHGVIELPGWHSSFSFSHTSEYWHGLTVGARAVIPLPPTVWLLGSGLVSLLTLRRFI